jgi:hypothetical protein
MLRTAQLRLSLDGGRTPEQQPLCDKCVVVSSEVATDTCQRNGAASS